MHVFKFFAFSDKKKVPGGLRQFASTSSLHPPANRTTNSPRPSWGAHGQEMQIGVVRSAKVLEMLGAENQEEYVEILTLINGSSSTIQVLEDTNSICEDGDGDLFLDRGGGGVLLLGDSSNSEQLLQQEEEEEEEEEEDSQAISTTSTSPRQGSGNSEHSRIYQGARQAEAASSGNSTPPQQMSPQMHFLRSPPQQYSTSRNLYQTAHPLPTPPPPSARTPSERPDKHQSRSDRNVVKRQPSPPPSPPPLPRAKVDMVKLSPRQRPSSVSNPSSECVPETVARPRPSLHSGPGFSRESLHQGSHVATSLPALNSRYLLSYPSVHPSPEQSSSPRTSDSPFPAYSTPQQSPPRTPSPLKSTYQSPQQSPRKKLSSSPPSARQSQMPMYYQLSGSQSPPQSPWSPASCNQSPPHSPWSLVPVPQCPRKWTKGERLGQGSFGTVYEGWNQEDGSFFAVKVSSQEDVSSEIQQEVVVLSHLNHPNIVRYLGSSIEDGCLCIFLELVRMGSLESILRKYKPFEENMIRTYTRQILYGLEYLHRQKTIHRDIKCANILVDVNGQVKLADFGVAKRVDLSLASSCKGTPLYMAPEVMMPSAVQRSYGFSADIWSLGCTVLEMADGKPPWSDLKAFGFFFKVKRGEVPPIPEHLSPDGKDFISRCLKLKPEDRPTATNLLQHPFVANAPTTAPVTPWLPSSPTAYSPMSSEPVKTASWYSPSPGAGSCYDQIVAGAQRAQALLYG